MAVSPANAQEKNVEATVAADVVSQYIWRGQDLGHVSIQPSLDVSYRGWSLTGWGSVGLSQPEDTKEFDLTLAYTLGGLNISLTDYWTSEGLDSRSRYFMYDAHSTNHVFEANVGYDFGVLSMQWFTNFAGNDGVNGKGKRAYSSYAELSAPFKWGGLDWTAAAGVVPYATDYYGVNGWAVTNVSLTATKELRVTDSFSLPLFATVAANPAAQKAYLVVGLTLSTGGGD